MINCRHPVAHGEMYIVCACILDHGAAVKCVTHPEDAGGHRSGSIICHLKSPIEHARNNEARVLCRECASQFFLKGTETNA